LLEQVGIPDPARRLDSYPHELSGGMRQRVVIAIAIACEPQVLIADEPTTALDVTVQAQIIQLVRDLQQRMGLAVVWISHDLAVIGQLADRVLVLYGGQVVEQADTATLFGDHRHPYTAGLLSSRPTRGRRRASLPTIPGEPPDLANPPPGCLFYDRCPRRSDELCARQRPDLVTVAPGAPGAVVLRRPGRRIMSAAPGDDAAELPLLQIRGLQVHLPVRGSARRSGEVVHAVQDLSFEVRRGETLGLVGESGSGKSTVGNALIRLVRPTAGTILLDGRDVTAARGPALREIRRRIAMVFQDPFASVDPRRRIRDTVAEPLDVHGLTATRAERSRRVTELLDMVGLRSTLADRYPHELSGGQRQRVAIARALAAKPDLVILDEATASLDVSVQAQILNLVSELQAELGLACLFIGHDLAVVEHMSDRIIVLYLGRQMEVGDAAAVFGSPAHPCTRALVAAVPPDEPRAARDAPAAVLSGEVPSPISPPSGCVFRTRCPLAIEQCADAIPPAVSVARDHRAACIRVPAAEPVGSASSG
jgi:peptide/nickel transport system ATP-binding protein